MENRIQIWSVNCARIWDWKKALSSSKCNGIDCIRPVFDEVEGAFWQEEFCWSFPSEGFSWSCVERFRDIVELLLVVVAELLSLGQVQAQQSVGVLVDASFPGAVGVGEVDLQASAFGEGFVANHLNALVVGHGPAHLGVEAVEDVGEALVRDGGLSFRRGA